MVKKPPTKSTQNMATSRTDPPQGREACLEPIQLEIKYPDTAILLVRSPERPVLLAAAAALSKFAETARGNLDALFDLDIVGNMINLIHHEDVFTQRFALKLLSLMSAVRNVRDHLLHAPGCMPFFTETLLDPDSDVFLQEFCSRILAEITAEVEGAAFFLATHADVSFLFDKLLSKDPDIRRNTIEIICNLLADYCGLKIVTRSKNFSFLTIYELFNEPYPVTQRLALSAIKRIAMHNANEAIQERLRDTEGLQYLLDIIEQDDWYDLYMETLDVLDTCCDNRQTAEYMNVTDGTKRLFDFMERSEKDELTVRALTILVRLAESTSGQKVLHARGIVPYLFKYAEETSGPKIQAMFCQGIGRLTQHPPAADEIAQYNPVIHVLSLLNNPEAEWTDRQAAAFSLKQLFATQFQNCINFLEGIGLDQLMPYIERTIRDVPWDTQVTIVQAITAIANYSSLTRDLIYFDLFSALCSNFELEDKVADELKIASCEALSRFPVGSAAAVRVLVETRAAHCLKRLITGTKESIPVREAASRLLLLLCTSSTLFATACVQDGYLVYMLKNRSVSRIIPTWSACIEALFSADLPMKFAYTGRLALHDVTADGFYVMRRSSCPFPVLEELFRLKLCPLEPIYVANFNEQRNIEADDYLASKQTAFDEALLTMRRESLERGMRISEGTLNAWLELKFGRLHVDRELVARLQRFKDELEARESEIFEDGSSPCCDNMKCEFNYSTPRNPSDPMDIGRISARARYLGEFVARELAGPDPHGCLNNQLEFHLRALKSRLENSVIPLGMLRVGGPLERAVLYKILADRIGLPAALVRGRYGQAWIEVAVPVLDKKSSASSNTVDMTGRKVPPHVGMLPARYLRENYIVDLIDEPGRFLPIGSIRDQHRCIPVRPFCELPCCKLR